MPISRVSRARSVRYNWSDLLAAAVSALRFFNASFAANISSRVRMTDAAASACLPRNVSSDPTCVASSAFSSAAPSVARVCSIVRRSRSAARVWKDLRDAPCWPRRSSWSAAALNSGAVSAPAFASLRSSAVSFWSSASPDVSRATPSVTSRLLLVAIGGPGRWGFGGYLTRPRRGAHHHQPCGRRISNGSVLPVGTTRRPLKGISLNLSARKSKAAEAEITAV